MENFVIDKNKNRALANARRLSSNEVLKENVITLEDGSFAYSIEVADELENIKTVEVPLAKIRSSKGREINEIPTMPEQTPTKEIKYPRIKVVSKLPVAE